jgi:putative phosphoribosyl transferase
VSAPDPAGSERRPVTVPAPPVELPGDLTLPTGAEAIVVFAHGSGSSRQSPRNRAVAGALADAGLATLLIDLLTADEEATDRATGALRFDVALLAERVLAAIDWLGEQPVTASLRVGLFGASTGAGAALVAAAARPKRVGATVSRGGRPDLAGDALERVEAPTLLIVGGRDEPLIELNRAALEVLGQRARLEIVDGATHLFEEPGALDEVVRLAADWFLTHLPYGNRP